MTAHGGGASTSIGSTTRLAVPRDAATRSRTWRATLNAMLDRIEHGVEEQHRLVADASHELRTPLAAMRAEIDVSLRADDLPPAAREVLESAREEVDRMSRTVDDLLVARAASTRAGSSCWSAPLDLHDVVARAVARWIRWRACAACRSWSAGPRGDGRRRPRPPRARGAQPDRERDQVQPRARRGRGHARGRRARRSGSPSATRGPASRPTSASGSSTASSAPTRRARGDRRQRPRPGHLARDRAGARRPRLGRRRRRGGSAFSLALARAADSAARAAAAAPPRAEPERPGPAAALPRLRPRSRGIATERGLRGADGAHGLAAAGRPEVVGARPGGEAQPADGARSRSSARRPPPPPRRRCCRG